MTRHGSLARCTSSRARTTHPHVRAHVAAALTDAAGSIGTASLWHVLRIIALFFLLFAELPVPCVLGASLALTHGSGIVSAWGTWNLAFSPSAGTFYASVLFVLEGLAILSLPTAVVGSATIGRLRWVNGWILLAAGVIDFLLGLLFQESIRWARSNAPRLTGQVAARPDRQARQGQIGARAADGAMQLMAQIKKQVKEAWQAISEHLKIRGLQCRTHADPADGTPGPRGSWPSHAANGGDGRCGRCVAQGLTPRCAVAERPRSRTEQATRSHGDAGSIKTGAMCQIQWLTLSLRPPCHHRPPTPRPPTDPRPPLRRHRHDRVTRGRSHDIPRSTGR